MVQAVIVTNVVISLVCFYVAWQLWKIRPTLANVADALTAYERSTQRGLSVSPPAIMIAQRGTYGLRQQYQKLDLQLQKLQNLLKLLSLGGMVWKGGLTGLRRSRSPKSSWKKVSRAQQQTTEID